MTCLVNPGKLLLPKRARKAKPPVVEPELVEHPKPVAKKSRPPVVAEPAEVEILPADDDDAAPAEIVLNPDAEVALEPDHGRTAMRCSRPPRKPSWRRSVRPRWSPTIR